MRSLCFSEGFWGLFLTNRKVRKGKPIILWTFLLSRSCYSNTTATRWSNSTFYFSLKNQTAENSVARNIFFKIAEFGDFWPKNGNLSPLVKNRQMAKIGDFDYFLGLQNRGIGDKSRSLATLKVLHFWKFGSCFHLRWPKCHCRAFWLA